MYDGYGKVQNYCTLLAHDLIMFKNAGGDRCCLVRSFCTTFGEKKDLEKKGKRVSAVLVILVSVLEFRRLFGWFSESHATHTRPVGGGVLSGGGKSPPSTVPGRTWGESRFEFGLESGGGKERKGKLRKTSDFINLFNQVTLVTLAKIP